MEVCKALLGSTEVQAIRRGIIQSFNPVSYTATVLLLEATSAALQNVPISNSVDGTSVVAGAYCAVLFFDANNYADAVVLACYPNGSGGVPSPTPGRVVFCAGYQWVNAQNIAANTVATYSVTGAGGIPAGALGVIYKAYFTSANVGTSIQLAPHNGSIANYDTIGNLQVAGQYVNGGGILQVDANGQIDIKANNNAATVSFFTHGYVF